MVGMPVKYSLRDAKDVLVLEFEIEGGVLDIKELPQVVEEMAKFMSKVETNKPVCISGRGPVWLYSALAVELANRGFTVATYEPRQNVCIIVTGREKGRTIPVQY